MRVTGSTSIAVIRSVRHDQAAVDRRGPAGQAAAGAAGHDRDAVRGREPHRRLHVLGRPGADHGEREPRVGVVGAVPAVLLHPLRIGDDDVVAELRDEGPEVDLLRSSHVGKTGSLMAKKPPGGTQRGRPAVSRVNVGGLQVASVLHAFVRDEALPGSGVDEAAFWSGVEAILRDFAPRNRELLARREELQQQLDEWHAKHPGPVRDQAAYVQLLRDLGYLLDEPADFTIETSDVDDEVAVQAGPQLVVPVLNARFAANAANARWGSLYDALYGTDVLPEDDGQERGTSYNPKRGAAVIARARAFLDEHFPLSRGQPRRRDRLHDRGRRADGRARRGPVRAGGPRPVRRPPRRPGRPRGRAAGPPRPARRDPGRPRPTRSAGTTRPA